MRRPAVLVGFLAIGCGREPTKPSPKLRTETIRRLDAGPADAMLPDAGPPRPIPPTNQAPDLGRKRLTNQAPKHDR